MIEEIKGMKISSEGINLIKGFEGFKKRFYRCSAHVLTIGYGSTKFSFTQKLKWRVKGITLEEAEQLLQRDVKGIEDTINKTVKVSLTQNQFDALVSLVYNIGEGAFKDSTLLVVLNRGKYDSAAQQFSRWIYSNKRTVYGLVTRRAEERALFEKIETNE